MTPKGESIIGRAVISARVAQLRDAVLHAHNARNALNAGRLSEAMFEHGVAARELHFTRGLFRRPACTGTLAGLLERMGAALRAEVKRLEVRS